MTNAALHIFCIFKLGTLVQIPCQRRSCKRLESCSILAAPTFRLPDDSDMTTFGVSLMYNEQGLKEVVEDMKTLIFILDVTAAPHQTQRRTEEASAGLHRIAVVNVFGELLEAGCPVMDGQLLALAVPGRLTALFFQYPWNSILQGSLCKFFLVSSAFR